MDNMTPTEIFSTDEMNEMQRNEAISRNIKRQCEIIESIIVLPDGEKKSGIDNYIKLRMAEISRNDNKNLDVISIVSGGSEGFINGVSEIRTNFSLDGFRMDDVSVYSDFIKSMSDMRSAGSKDSVRSLIGRGLFTTVNGYFGREVRNSHLERMKFYQDISGTSSDGFSISEMKGKGIAECLEKSSLSNNLLALMGFETELVLSLETRVDQESSDFHAFVFAESGTAKTIFEITNPVIIKDESGKRTAVYPAVYQLDRQQINLFNSGEQISVTHTDYLKDATGENVPVSTKRMYCKK